MLSKTIPTDSACFNDSEKKYSLTYLQRTVSYILKKGSEIKSFGSTGIKQVKMPQFCWQWSQNARLVNTFQI